MYDLFLEKSALKDIELLKKSGSESIVHKLSKLLKEIREHPRSNIRYFRPLRGQISKIFAKISYICEIF